MSAVRFPICLSIDLKKNRIRIYKDTLRALRCPRYVRFLVDPGFRLLSVQIAAPTDQCACRVDDRNTDRSRSVEIHSIELMHGLKECMGWNRLGTYRIYAKARLDNDCLVFPLDEAEFLNNKGQMS